MRYCLKSILFMAALALFASCGGRVQKKSSGNFHREEGMVWNTEFHITYDAPVELGDSIRSVLDRVGKTFSVFDPSSLTCTVNRQDSTPVNTDFIRVFVMSQKVNRLSDGAFDPTLSPLITAWGFGPGHKATPDTARVDSILQFVGIGKTRLRHDALIKDDIRTQFNFSALAKGYGCDMIAAMFSRNRVSNFLVEIGGEIYASGRNPEGSEWRISIDRPVYSDSLPTHVSQMVIKISNIGMATSGNYRNFHGEGDQRYGHTISPATGRPVATDVLSATVLAPTSMEADALATAFMAMGSEKAMALAGRMRLPAMLVCGDTVLTTKEFSRLIVK